MPAAFRTIYFKNNVGCLWEEPEAYLRLDYYPGKRELAQFQALLNHTRQAMQRHAWSQMLIDQRQMSPFTDRESTWMVDEWLPLAVRENGYRYGAVLVAHDVFARLAMTNVVLATRQLDHFYHNFEDEISALTWLLAQGAVRG